MRSIRKVLFKTETVSILLIAQALLDGYIIVMIVNALMSLGLIRLANGPDTLSLIKWSFVSSWMLSIFLVSLIFGISVVNRSIFYKQIVVAVLFYGIIQLGLFGTGQIDAVSPGNIFIIFSVTACAILVFRSALFVGYKLLSMLGSQKRVIIIGCNEKAELLARSLRKDVMSGNQLLGFFDNFDPEDDFFKNDFKGYLEDVKSFCVEQNVKEIYYTLPMNKEYVNDLSEFADRHFIFLGIVPDLEMQKRRKIDASYLADVDLPIISYRYSPLQHRVNFYIKRGFDVCFSIVAMILLAPVLLPAIAIAIRLDSPGPIFFVQQRPGRNNKLFDCYKFRSMYIDNDDTERAATRSDRRVTRVGSFLRKTSLDELPQFFNVLKGDMSIVGPRPNLISHLKLYSEEIPEYSLRHIVTPGITGFAQISGYRGEIKEGLMEKRLEYDLSYLQNWSLSMDLKIIAKTMIQVIRGDEKAY